MVISSSHIYSKGNLEVVKTNNANKINVKKFPQNGQIQIYQSSYRGSYTAIIRDSLRNAALGRKVLYAASLVSNYTACRKNLNNGN